MADACCGPDPSAQDATEVHESEQRLWHVRDLQIAAAAALLLAISWLIGRTAAGTAVALVAAIIAASTFVPNTAVNLRHGRIGVGTLMTIAAIGAIALGQINEAAMLGILFSVAEGLEHYAVTKTRRGLRALLALVPPTVSVLRAAAKSRSNRTS